MSCNGIHDDECFLCIFIDHCEWVASLSKRALHDVMVVIKVLEVHKWISDLPEPVDFCDEHFRKQFILLRTSDHGCEARLSFFPVAEPYK